MIQKDPRLARIEQRSQGITTLMALVMVILLIQLWLLTVALEAHLAAHESLAVPTFLASGFCFIVNLGLLKYLYDIDRKSEE